MPRTKVKAPEGMVFVCPRLCGYQRCPLLNGGSDAATGCTYRCPACGAVGTLQAWTRPWYKVDTLGQAIVEATRQAILPLRKRYCNNRADYKVVVDRRGIHKLGELLEPTVKVRCERNIPFMYSSRSFEGSGWTQILLCRECVCEIAEAGRRFSEDLRKQEHRDGID